MGFFIWVSLYYFSFFGVVLGDVKIHRYPVSQTIMKRNKASITLDCLNNSKNTTWKWVLMDILSWRSLIINNTWDIAYIYFFFKGKKRELYGWVNLISSNALPNQLPREGSTSKISGHCRHQGLIDFVFSSLQHVHGGSSSTSVERHPDPLGWRRVRHHAWLPSLPPHAHWAGS